MKQEPNLPRALEDSITEHFYRLSARLQAAEHFLWTLKRFGIVNYDQMRAIYHNTHISTIELFRKYSDDDAI